MMSNDHTIDKSKLIQNLSDPNITPTESEKSKLPSLRPKEQSISPDGNQE